VSLSFYFLAYSKMPLHSNVRIIICLGVYFHISVLAAAGLGNTLSDVVGIFFGKRSTRSSSS